jgi:hypothetical protein
MNPKAKQALLPHHTLRIGPHFFNALSWVRQTTFPADLETGLVALGTSPEVAREIGTAYGHTQQRDIVRFYEEYAYSVSSKDWQEALAGFISARLAQYDKYGKHELTMVDYLQAQLEQSKCLN